MFGIDGDLQHKIMIFNEKWLAFSIFIGATLFLYGFFPLSYTSNERAAIEDLPDFIDDIR